MDGYHNSIKCIYEEVWFVSSSFPTCCRMHRCKFFLPFSCIIWLQPVICAHALLFDRFKRVGPNAMRGRGIGTARGRATIMRGLSSLFTLLCFPDHTNKQFFSFLCRWYLSSLANGAERIYYTLCLYYKLIDVAMLTSPTWTRSRTSGTRNQALELGVYSISDNLSSKVVSSAFEKIVKRMEPYFDSPSQNSSHIFGVLLSIALFMYHFVNTECMKIDLSGLELYFPV